MKTTHWLALMVVAAILGGAAGAGVVFALDRLDQPERPLAEGVIYSIVYQWRDSSPAGFTRKNEPKAVPGGSGSWNVDASGKLYRDFLVITFPDKKDLGPLVIPSHRLVSVQFGDGGIKQMPQTAEP
jgi:hypothetical protein